MEHHCPRIIKATCGSISQAAFMMRREFERFRLLRCETLIFLLTARHDSNECVFPIDKQVEDLLRFLRLMILFEFFRIDGQKFLEVLPILLANSLNEDL